MCYLDFSKDFSVNGISTYGREGFLGDLPLRFCYWNSSCQCDEPKRRNDIDEMRVPWVVMDNILYNTAGPIPTCGPVDKTLQFEKKKNGR